MSSKPLVTLQIYKQQITEFFFLRLILREKERAHMCPSALTHTCEQGEGKEEREKQTLHWARGSRWGLIPGHWYHHLSQNQETDA